ncbi:MAG: radical SAM protein [Candidatus Micrarchaeia archaeon]
MKIVFVKPFNDLNPRYIPLNYLVLGSVLKEKGCKVKIIDSVIDRNWKSTLLREGKDASAIGVGCITADVKYAYEICEFSKENLPDVPIVWGGIHATLFPEQVAASKLVDYAVHGEGEKPLCELLDALERGTDTTRIKGLAFKKKPEGVQINPRPEFVDLNSLPETDYDLIDLNQYFSGTQRFLPYQSSRGCPHRCAFCVNPLTGNSVYRSKTAEKVVDETKRLAEKYKLDYVYFIDDNFFVDFNRAKKFAELKIASDAEYTWFGECRVNYFAPYGPIDEKYLELLYKSGLRSMTLGAESGSEKMLAYIDKDISPEQITNSAQKLAKYDISAGYSFIIGYPNEDEDDLMQTVSLAKKIRKINPHAFFAMSILTPYPGSKLTEDLKKKGLFKEPTSLEEWASKETVDLYTNRFVGKPWQKNKRLLEAISYCTQVGYNTYDDKTIGNLVQGLKVWRYPDLFFIYLARKRFEGLYFDLLVEDKLFEGWTQTKKLLYHRLWKKNF